jgi:3-phenylpropionate/trans-cinnamate dioxygenase ferredoxin reductase subunit
VTERLVIIGAALTGGTAAVTLRNEGFEGSLTLIGSERHLPYERPPLSKSFLRGETPFEDALVQPEAFYRDNGIELRLGETATAIDTSAKIVGLESGDQVPFDRLLLATGARNRRFPIPGLDLPGVHSLRTVDEAEALREEISPGRRAVVVGMGFIGSEVTASLRQRGVEITAVDGGTVPLERVMGQEVGGVLAGIHRDHGVDLVFRDQLAALEGDDRVERVVTRAGRTLECDFAVVGVGVQPVAELAAEAGIEVDNGVLVDELCRTSVTSVYAAGDVANHYHPVFRRRIRTEHWQNARRQGRAAALNMLGKAVPYDEIHWFWSDQYDHNLQYAGFHTEWDDIVVRGSLEDRKFAAFYLKDGRVQAVVAIDRGREVMRSMPLIKGGQPVEEDKLRDETVDLQWLAEASRIS